MIQLLLHGLKMDPIVSVHYYAPVCAVINLCILPFTEGLEPIYALHRVGLLVLFTNALTAFALNMAAVFLISVGSGLVLTLAGVLKDIVSREAGRGLALIQTAPHHRLGPRIPQSYSASADLWLLVRMHVPLCAHC